MPCPPDFEVHELLHWSGASEACWLHTRYHVMHTVMQTEQDAAMQPCRRKLLRCACSSSARAGSCKCRVVVVREHPRCNSCTITQLWHLGIQLEHQSLTRCEARPSGQSTNDKRSSSICPTANVQQRLPGCDASVQRSSKNISEADVAQGQSNASHFTSLRQTQLVNSIRPARRWPRQ